MLDCTAVGYYFGQRLRRHLKIPIGLVDVPGERQTVVQHPRWRAGPTERRVRRRCRRHPITPELIPLVNAFPASGVPEPSMPIPDLCYTTSITFRAYGLDAAGNLIVSNDVDR